MDVQRNHEKKKIIHYLQPSNDLMYQIQGSQFQEMKEVFLCEKLSICLKRNF